MSAFIRLFFVVFFLQCFPLQIYGQPFYLRINGMEATNPVDLQFRKLAMLHCDSTTFQRGVDFSESSLAQPAYFRHAYFKDDVFFKKFTFGQKAYFAHAVFKGKCNFQGVYAIFGIDFNSAHFYSTAYFWLGKFDSTTSFNQAFFHADALFIQSHFQCATFNETAFYGEARFDDAIISDTLYFQGATWPKGIFLERAKLGKHLIFENIDFKGITRLKDAVLPDTLQLLNCQSSLPLDFDQCKPNPRGACLFYPEYFPSEKLWVDFQYMELWFPPSTLLSFQEKKECFEAFLKIEKKRKRKESYNALKYQYGLFLEYARQ